jgi:hypothetical protein
MRKILDFYRAVKLACGLAFRMFGTGKIRLFPYRHEELLSLGTLHELYEGDHKPEDFVWISPVTAWKVARGIWLES